MIQPPPEMGLFQFVVLSTLRVKQLVRGCLPRVDGTHKATVIARIEVAQRKVMAANGAAPAVGITNPQAAPAVVITNPQPPD